MSETKTEIFKSTPEQLKEILAKHVAYLRGEAAGVRADLSSANLSYANLRSADLPNRIRWEEYLSTLLPGLFRAGGRKLIEVVNPATFACHEWANCPMAEAFGVYSTADVPALYRAESDLFIALFDGRALPLELLQGVPEIATIIAEEQAAYPNLAPATQTP